MGSMGDNSFLALITLGSKCHLQENKNSRSQESFKTTIVKNRTPVSELLFDVILVIEVCRFISRLLVIIQESQI